MTQKKGKTSQQQAGAQERKDPTSSPELQEDVKKMNEEQMYNLLIELVDTEYWKAIKKFFDSRALEAEQSLFSLDPIQNPSSIAKVQGLRLGYLSLESSIVQKIEDRKEKSKEESGENEFKNEFDPGYNKF